MQFKIANSLTYI